MRPGIDVLESWFPEMFYDHSVLSEQEWIVLFVAFYEACNVNDA